MRRPARVFGTAILTAYAGLLVVAAWPASLRPSAFDDATRIANRFFARLRLSPGQVVFLGIAPDEWKIRAWCPSIIGQLDDGSLHVLYRPTDECFWNGVRFLPDRFYVTFQGLLNAAGKAWTKVGDERRNGIYGAISDYFCEHPSGTLPLPKTVIILEHRVFKSFATGKVRGQLVQAYAWSCSARALAPLPWPVVPQDLALGPEVTP